MILKITPAILGTLVLIVPALVLAGTVASFSPTTTSVKVGQKFNVMISIDPQGTVNYVEKLELNYPADILEVNSFTFENNWIPMTQEGYFLTDNTNGVLIRTAGYPKGITTSTIFGTALFTAKKAGTGVIKIGNNSFAFEAKSQTAITGSDMSFTITVPVVVPTPTVTPPPTTTAPKTVQTTKTTSIETASISTSTISTTTENVTSQTAAVVQTESTSKVWAWVLGVLALIVIVGYGIYTSTKKQ